MSERVMATTGEKEYPGTIRYWIEGEAYVVLDNGSQGSFPRERLRPLEDKDAPRAGMETK